MHSLWRITVHDICWSHTCMVVFYYKEHLLCLWLPYRTAQEMHCCCSFCMVLMNITRENGLESSALWPAVCFLDETFRENAPNWFSLQKRELFCSSQSKFPFLLYCTILQPNARQINSIYKIAYKSFYSLCKTQSEASLTCSLCIFPLSSVLHLLVHFASRDQICIATPILSFISVLCLLSCPLWSFGRISASLLTCSCP